MTVSVAAKRAEIRMRYGCMARASRRDRRAPLTMTTLRTSQLESIYRHRFGGRFPQNKAGLDALQVMAEHFIQRSALEMVVGWIQARAPWVDDVTAAAIAGDAVERTSRLTAGQLGWRIKLTKEERRLLRVTTIRAMGQTDETMAEDRRERDRERKAKERRAAGCKTRAEYEAESKTQTKPWEAMGMSRSDWYRKGRPTPPPKSETGPSPTKIDKISALERPVSLSKEVAPSALCRAQARSDQRSYFRGKEPENPFGGACASTRSAEGAIPLAVPA